MGRRALAAVALSMTLGACEIFVPLDGLTGRDAGTEFDSGAWSPDSPDDQGSASEAQPPGADGPSDASPSSEASVDEGVIEAGGPSAPVSIVSVGSITAPSGHAQQGPLVWLSGAESWWLFYVDATAPTQLTAVGSTDFRTWSTGGSITLPGPVVDGRNLAASAGTAAGNDVVHLGVSISVASNDRRHLHARAHPVFGMLQFDTFAVLGTTTYTAMAGLDPDSPATAIGADDTVLDTSGWYAEPDGGATGNEYAWLTTSPDPGGAWTPPWGAPSTVEQVMQFVNARALLPLTGGDHFALWESGDSEPDPSNVRFAVLSSGQWTTAADVFVASTQDPNDWGACRLGSTVHAVRHTSAGAWEHRVWSGSSFADGGAMPPLAAPAGSGVVALCDGTRVRVLSIAPEPGSPVKETRWDGMAWNAWSEVVAAGGKRSYLSGTIGPSGQAAVVWTESGDGGATVAGAIVPN